MVDYFFVEIYNRSLPSGRGYANVWQVEMGLLPETSPDYRAPRATRSPCWEIMSG